MGLWVAVAYNTKFYVGKITELSSAEEIEIDFLTKKKDGSFRWPKPQDLKPLYIKIIFFQMQGYRKLELALLSST